MRRPPGTRRPQARRWRSSKHRVRPPSRPRLRGRRCPARQPTGAVLRRKRRQSRAPGDVAADADPDANPQPQEIDAEADPSADADPDAPLVAKITEALPAVMPACHCSSPLSRCPARATAGTSATDPLGPGGRHTRSRQTADLHRLPDRQSGRATGNAIPCWSSPLLGVSVLRPDPGWVEAAGSLPGTSADPVRSAAAAEPDGRPREAPAGRHLLYCRGLIRSPMIEPGRGWAYVVLFSEIGISLLVTTLIGVFAGRWVDGQLGTNPGLHDHRVLPRRRRRDRDDHQAGESVPEDTRIAGPSDRPAGRIERGVDAALLCVEERVERAGR